MTKKEIKYLIGIFAATTSLTAIYIPASILAAVQESFPNVSATLIQMIVSLPAFFGIASNLIFSKMAHKVYKKSIVLGCLTLFTVGGLIPFFLHQSIAWLILAACLVGFALGGIQNSVTTLICDYFEGDKRGAAMGLLSVFIGLGGVLFTFVASRLGAIKWHYAYLTYLLLLPLLLLSILFMPSGILEEKPTKKNRVKVPSHVIFMCVFAFFFFTTAQLFNSDISLLISEKGFGATAEAGNVTSIYNIAVMVAGLVVLPFMKLCKKMSLTVIYIFEIIGCTLLVICTNIPVACVGAIAIAIGFGMFTPLLNQEVADACPPMGLAFNIAVASAVGQLGQAASPVITGFVVNWVGGSAVTYFVVGAVNVGVFAVLSAVYFAVRAKRK